MAVEWTPWTRGWGADAKLANGLKLTVSKDLERLPKDEPSFNVYVFGLRLKERSMTQQEAQARAERVAKAWLTEALAKLDG